MDKHPRRARSTRPQPEVQNVLIATDFGEPAESAFSYARGIARAFGARLHVLHVAEDLSATTPLGPPSGIDLGRRQMDLQMGARDRLRDMLDDRLKAAATETIVMTSNRPAAEILRYAEDAKVDLIVLGTHGRGGFSEFVMGSVAQQVVRRARCPVMTMRAPAVSNVSAD